MPDKFYVVENPLHILFLFNSNLTFCFQNCPTSAEGTSRKVG